MKTILKSSLVLVTTMALIRVAVGQYVEADLTGYQKGTARFTDPNLNGWGMDFAPNGTACIANTCPGVVTFYEHSGKPLKLIVTVPPAPSQPFGPVGTPAGVVYNPTSEFVISANGKSAPARFIFDTLDGVICGWNPDVDPTHAIIIVDNSTEAIPASYTGLVMAKNSHGQNVLYAADGGYAPDFSNNRIDMFDSSFHSIGSFTDPNAATEYPGNTAFQVEEVDGQLFVTFGGFSPPFGGVVDIFTTDGVLLTPNHFAANAPGAGPLVNPWGIAKAPSNFGKFSNAILISEVEDGHISAFDQSGHFLGQLQFPNKTDIIIPGVWDIAFVRPNSNELTFNAGPNATDFCGNGLYGIISATKKKN